MMKLVEVRCCCEPMKLLGHLPIPAETPIAVGVSVKFLIPSAGRVKAGEFTLLRDPEHLRLTIEQYSRPDGNGTGLAFKSDDTPIGTLRRIPAFIEA